MEYGEYIFGRFMDTATITSENDIESLILDGRNRVPQLSGYPIYEIINLLHKIGSLWAKKDGEYYTKAFDFLTQESGLSEEMTRLSLKIIPEILSKESLVRRLKMSLPYPIDVLDQWYRPCGFPGQIRALPRGVVFHISAGNIFLGAIDSLIMGFLSKNINILKLSRNDPICPILFAQSMKECDDDGVISSSFCVIGWKGGRGSLESSIATHADGIMVWGGEDAVKNYRQNAGLSTKVVCYGPKISLGIITLEGLNFYSNQDAARRFANDIALWDQSACSSPQNIFIESRVPPENLKGFISHLSRELEDAGKRLPRAKMDINISAEITKQREFYRFKASQDDAIVSFPEARHDYTIVYDKNNELTPSPLGRFILLKPFDTPEDLSSKIRPYWHYLQSAGFLVAPHEFSKFRKALSAAGVNRCTEAGGMLGVADGAPHDTTLPIAELLRWVNSESLSFIVPEKETIRNHLKFIRKHSPLYSRLWKAVDLDSQNPLGNIPVLTKQEFLKSSPPESYEIVTNDILEKPMIFASGGSTGTPKFSYYTQGEFDTIASALADNYLMNDVTKEDRVANLFVAGYLWSSFLAVDRAINKIGATNLPIGGQTEIGDIIKYLEIFKPTVIMGLPSQLAELARQMDKKGIRLNVNIVFYAGEEMGEPMRQQLYNCWGVTKCKSAGYASVDAGPIGYQCPFQEKGVHHMYSNLQILEILDFEKNEPVPDGTVGEITVTNLFRRLMPFIRYRAGDQGILFPPSQCQCGRTDPVFRLLGRCDDRLLIGGSRVNIREIEPLLLKHECLTSAYQFVPCLKDGKEHLEVWIESSDIAIANEMKEQFEKEFMSIFADFYMSVQKGWIGNAEIKFVNPGDIPRVKRTGKLKLIRDLRRD